MAQFRSIATDVEWIGSIHLKKFQSGRQQARIDRPNKGYTIQSYNTEPSSCAKVGSIPPPWLKRHPKHMEGWPDAIHFLQTVRVGLDNLEGLLAETRQGALSDVAVFAEFERAVIQERVRAGLRRVVSKGKQLGRPSISTDVEQRIMAVLKAGKSIRKAAEGCGRQLERGAAGQEPFRRRHR
jgi:hypothetical protein